MRSWLRNHFFTRIKEREETERLAFSENGSKLFEKLIVSCNGKPIPIRSFSAQQLCLATNNYNNHRGIRWCKGSLEGRVVFVRQFPNSKILTDCVINDLAISAKMCAHSNVLKPIGCCLNTPSPILVYEFAANGILSDRIYASRVTQRHHDRSMAWASRLKIGRQIAHAISYLQTAFSRPVIHMGIHMDSILLDEHDVPKLSNFLASTLIPEGETDVETNGNVWYSRFKTLEIKATGKATEKLMYITSVIFF